MIKTIGKYPVLTLLVVVLLLMLPELGHLQVTIMEARNFITAREMISDGNWFLTTMNGVPRYEKPPLPTWITAIFEGIFGIKNVYALRLPAVLMVWITGSYTYLFSKIITGNKRNSLINGLITVTSFYIIAIVVEAPWDIYTHGFMIAAIYYLYKALKSSNKWNYVATSLFIACSVFSKGPISLYALLLPFLLAYAITNGIKNKFILKALLMLIAGMAFGSIWFIYIRIADSETFMKIAMVETANWSSYNVKPFYYYWSFFIQSGIWAFPALMGLFYPYMIKRVYSKNAYKLSFLWTIFAVVLLSLVPEKKARYLMPILIPLAINTGFYIQYLIAQFKNLKNKAETIPIYFNFGLFSFMALLFPLGVYLFLPEEFRQNLSLIFILYPVLLFSSGGIFYLLLKKNMLHTFYLTIVFYITIILLIIPVNPDFNIKNGNYKSISDLKDKVEKEHINVYFMDAISPEILWDYGGIIPQIPEFNQCYQMPNEEKFGVLVADTALITFGAFNNEYTIQHKETYDINLGKYGTRKHKPRYVSNYYIFQRGLVKSNDYGK